MLVYISKYLIDLSNYAQGYNLNPLTFLVIYFGTTPFILIPVYVLGKIAMKKVDKKYFTPLLTTLIIAIITPYLYVVFFGVGINIYVKLGVVIFAIFSLFRFLSKKLNIRVMAIMKNWLSKLWIKK